MLTAHKCPGNLEIVGLEICLTAARQWFLLNPPGTLEYVVSCSRAARLFNVLLAKLHFVYREIQRSSVLWREAQRQRLFEDSRW